MRRGLVTVAGLLLTTCADAPPAEPAPPPLDDVLVIDTAAAVKANAAAAPGGFAGPVETRCGPDPSRAFLLELAADPTHSKVPFHWAPVIGGASSDAPTVAQPEVLLSGTVRAVSHSADDVAFDHVYGYDESFDIAVDPAFASLVYPGQSGGELHTEIDQGLYPEKAFGWTLAAGDRAVAAGAWILDCGHPPYGSEIHPPTLLAFARSDGKTTTSLAFANPYRETQLYHADASLVTAFSDDTRYEDAGSKPFPAHLVSEILEAKAGTRMRFDVHDLLEPVRFAPLTWYVCAPRSKPVGAQLDASWRFATRTGVSIAAARLEAEGCVRFTATMTSEYRPSVPVRKDVVWPWTMIDMEASGAAGMSVDVRQKIIDTLGGGTYAALALDNPPLIDSFDALVPRADAALDSPTVIAAGADDQPYPFYGRARVQWR